jgi:hypothetical protein
MSSKDAVRVLTVKDNSRYIVEVDVGRMPPAKVKEYLKHVASMLKSGSETSDAPFIPKDAQVLIVPVVDGVPTMRITALEGEE